MAGIGRFMVGERVRFSGTFSDPVTLIVTDPPDVTVLVKDPSGNVTTATYNAGAGQVVKDSTGKYSYYIDTTGKPGTWYARMRSPVGTAQAAAEGDILIDASQVEP